MKKSSFLLTCLAALVFVGCYEVEQGDYSTEEKIEMIEIRLNEEANKCHPAYETHNTLSFLHGDGLDENRIDDCFEFVREIECVGYYEINLPDECF